MDSNFVELIANLSANGRITMLSEWKLFAVSFIFFRMMGKSSVTMNINLYTGAHIGIDFYTYL